MVNLMSIKSIRSIRSKKVNAFLPFAAECMKKFANASGGFPSPKGLGRG
jgi:hypothetical protein